MPDGTPNQEYGATILNGDGLLYRFDFSEPGRVLLKSRLLKPACYYADEATRYGTDYYERGLPFISKGLSRTHLHLGTRNQLNTSLLESEVRILHWRGGKMDSWRIMDSDSGEPIAITQTVHQMALTEDYVILSDSTLKFAMDMLLSLPFGHHDRLNDLVRKLTTHKIRSETPCYLVRRADLVPDQQDVVAVRCDLPYETIHFSAEYRNPENRITLHGSHNSAICGGEWVRPFDRLAVDPDQPVPANRIGGMATSAMDNSRVGKHVIDGRSGELLQSQVLHQKGFPKDRVKALAGPHTWGVGLYTFRGYHEAEPAPDRIRYIFHQFNGLAKEELTRFVYELYLDYNEKHAEIPAEKILDYHRKGIPGCLCRLDTESMELTDHFPFGKHEIMLSLQFIPRRRDGDTATELDPGLDGYLLCLMQVGLTPDGSRDGGYSRQLYLFDAADLRAGPVCILSHDNLAWSLTIHSLYCAEIAAPTLDYRVDIPEDCNWILDRFPDAEKRQSMRDFLEREVYPHYSTGGE